MYVHVCMYSYTPMCIDLLCGMCYYVCHMPFCVYHISCVYRILAYIIYLAYIMYLAFIIYSAYIIYFAYIIYLAYIICLAYIMYLAYIIRAGGVLCGKGCWGLVNFVLIQDEMCSES